MMKMRSIILISLAILFSFQSVEAQKGKVTLVTKEAEKKVDVMIDGQLFTSYIWPDNVWKPVLYPVNTSAGTAVTRGYPLNPRDGERNDHTHQIGLWLTYGNVNGFDFWGNGSRGLGVKNPNGGFIKHINLEKSTDGKNEAVLISNESWQDPDGKELLKERTEYHFIARNGMRIIDRVTTLTATNGPVLMTDTKEGMFGMRMARQLELPSKDRGPLFDSKGQKMNLMISANEGVTGNYRSSEGVTGEAVWSTRAKWMDLYGNFGDEKVSVVLVDHPGNVSYPTYWHARGYGLFCLNPFGVKDFTKGKQQLYHKILPGQSMTLKYRTIVHSGSHLTDAQINKLSDEFAAKY